MKNILVIRLSSLGDVILTGPTTLNLKLTYPESTITYLTGSRYVSLAGALPGVDRALALERGQNVFSLAGAALKLEDNNFDLIVDLHGNLRSTFLRVLMGANTKVSYAKRRLGRELIVRRKRTNRPVDHVIDSYNQSLRKIDSNFALSATHPILRESFSAPISDAPEKIQRWLADNETILLLAPGARHETKQAPLELFASAGESASDGKLKVICIRTRSESNTSLAEFFTPDNYAELVDAPLELLSTVMRRSAAALSNDSGIAHLCSANGLPVTVLFGPTHPALGFAPRGVFDRVLETDEYCRPCSLHGSRPCFRDQRHCFTGISQQQVQGAITEMLERRRKRSRALFLDRDGAVIVEKGFLGDPAQVELYSGAAQSLREALNKGWKLVIVSNQSGVARGLITEEQVKAVNKRVLELLSSEGVDVTDIYYAPEHPDGSVEGYRTADNLRKPSDGMFLRAAREHNIDLSSSWVIGDRPGDYLSGYTIGGRGVLVKTGYGAESLAELERYAALPPEFVAEDLPSAVNTILSLPGRR